MKRIVLLLAIVFLALLTVRGVVAAPQHHKGTGITTLSGVVLGPDDRPVPHAAVTYQSSGGNAPHAVHGMRKAISRSPSSRPTITICALPERAFSPSGRKTSTYAKDKQKRDTALDLREGSSQSLRQ